METLRQILAEEAASLTASVELYKSGLSKPGYIKRPLEAPEWSLEAQARFREGWTNQMKQSSRKAPGARGGDGVRRLRRHPEGRRDARRSRVHRWRPSRGSTGSSCVPAETEEEQQQFYADVLAPLAEEFTSILDFGLLLAEYGEDDYYFELDMNTKLQGNLEGRSQAITATTGQAVANGERGSARSRTCRRSRTGTS